MHFLVVPDSFKGSLSAFDFCKIAKEVLSERFPSATFSTYPAFDGGEGSVETIAYLTGAQTLTTTITDGNFFQKKGTYAFGKDTAYIAVANSSGLPDTLIKDPFYTTTFGMGEQILQAKHIGKKNFVLCLGGSSTNDGGAGLVSALGGKFLRRNGESFVPTGGTLAEIDSLDLTDFIKNIEGLTFTALCDVKNPLLGENGCSFVFAPQKGAKTPEKQRILEENMQHFAEKTAFLGCSPEWEGTGAAGGLGYCVLAFLKGKLLSGSQYFLDLIHFTEECEKADYILTGEGKFDKTSSMGKLIGTVLSAVRKENKKINVFCGKNASESLPNGIEGIFECNDSSLTLAENMEKTEEHFRKALQIFADTVLL